MAHRGSLIGARQGEGHMVQKTTFLPLTSEKLYDLVAGRLREMILRGELAVGESLPPEKDMAEEFGVSRTVIRDAIRILKAEGLIRVKHGVGSIVTQDGREAFNESLRLLIRRGGYSQLQLLEAREVLEVAIVGLSAVRVSAEEMEKLYELLERYRQSIVNQDAEAADSLNEELHLDLVRASGSRVLVDIVGPILSLYVAMSQPSIEDPHPMTSYLLHKAILDKLNTRDAAGAQEAMHEHMRDAAAYLLQP